MTTKQKKVETKVETQVKDKQEPVNVDELEAEVHTMREAENARLEEMDQMAKQLRETERELDQEIAREKIARTSRSLWESTKSGARYIGYLATGPIPRTRREVGLAVVWYGLGAVTPLGEPARSVVRAVRS